MTSSMFEKREIEINGYIGYYGHEGRVKVDMAATETCQRGCCYVSDRPYFISTDCGDKNVADYVAAAIASAIPTFAGSVINAALAAMEKAQGVKE